MEDMKAVADKTFKCENCHKEVQYLVDRYTLHIGWKDVGEITGVPFDEDLYFVVCGIKCGLELINKMRIEIENVAEFSIKKDGS